MSNTDSEENENPLYPIPPRYRIEVRIWRLHEPEYTIMSTDIEGPARVVSESARAAIDEFLNYEER